jgi:uncharacterized protein YndB with AHSA1/START domain
MKVNAAIAALVLTLSPSLAMPEVADSSANGFTVKATFTINAGPDEVYRRLINVGDWWDSAHTFSGDARNLSIDEKPMGCFCEKLPNRGSVRHMEVVFLAPGKRLVMTGALGPLQSMAAAANMTIQFSPADGGTKLDVTYAVAGYTPKGMNTMAAPVDSVLTQQFTRLKSHVEGGLKPLSPK